MSFKKVIYYSTLVCPILNIIRKAIVSIAEEVMKVADNRRYLEEVNRFVESERDDGPTPFYDITSVIGQNVNNEEKKGKEENGSTI